MTAPKPYSKKQAWLYDNTLLRVISFNPTISFLAMPYQYPLHMFCSMFDYIINVIAYLLNTYHFISHVLISTSHNPNLTSPTKSRRYLSHITYIPPSSTPSTSPLHSLPLIRTVSSNAPPKHTHTTSQPHFPSSNTALATPYNSTCTSFP